MAITYDSIATQTVTNSTTSSVTFSNIPQTFTDLVVTGLYAFQTDTTFQLAINGNNPSNGAYVSMFGSSTTRQATRQSGVRLEDTIGGTNVLSAIKLDINGYRRTNMYKVYYSHIGNTNAAGSIRYTFLASGAIFTTAAITSLTLTSSNSLHYFTSGSSFALYGILTA